MSSIEEAIKYLPETLNHFLKMMFVGTHTEVKPASIGQAIMQATHAIIIIAPLQLGLGRVCRNFYLVQSGHR